MLGPHISDDEEELLDSGSGFELIFGDASFKPVHILFSWQEVKEMNILLSVAILLSSEVGAEDFLLRVCEGGDCIDLTTSWPHVLLGTDLLHCKWMKAMALEEECREKLLELSSKCMESGSSLKHLWENY